MTTTIIHKGHVFYWTFLFTGINLSVKAAYTLMVLLMAVVLTRDAYADFSIIYSLQTAMTTFAVIGLGEVTAGRLKAHPIGIRRQILFQRMSGFFCVTALAALVMIAPFMAMTLVNRDLVVPTILAVLLGTVISFSVLQAGFHRIDERHLVSLLSSALVPFSGIVGFVIGGWWAQSLELIYWLGFFCAGITLTILILKKKMYIGPVPKLAMVRREIINLVPFYVIGIFGWLSGYGMNFFIGLWFGLEYIAIFTLLFTIASIGQLMANSLNMVWTPHFIRLFNAEEVRYAESQGRYFFAILAIVLGIASAAAVGLLPWVTGLIGGNLSNYSDYRLELALLIIGYILAIPWWLSLNYYYVTSYGHELMVLSLWSGGAGLLVWVICMVALGPIGIFVGFPLQMAVKSLLMWKAASKYWHIRPPWKMMALGCTIVFSALLLPAPS
jgi:O-antigen/teichoic acid export membrane protein